MSLTLQWHGDQLQRQLHNATAAGLQRATVYLHQQCRRAVARPNTGVRVPVRRRTKGGNRRSRTIYPHPSRPGESPRLRTGFGQRNVVMEFNASEPVGRVGITRNALYMLYLELGTRRVARRPWLVKTLLQHQTMIGKLATSGE